MLSGLRASRMLSMYMMWPDVSAAMKFHLAMVGTSVGLKNAAMLGASTICRPSDVMPVSSNDGIAGT